MFGNSHGATSAGSARGPMQKLPAGTFHRFLPASSRNARLDAQKANDEAGTPADSIVLPFCNDQDFGTSAWQLSEKLNRFSACVEGGCGRKWPMP